MFGSDVTLYIASTTHQQRGNAVILFFHSSNTAGFMKVRETGYIHPFSFFFCYSTYFHKAISF